MADEREARRAEVLEKKRQEQMTELEERVAELEREVQEKKKELERERERGQERERRLAEREAEVLERAEEAREKKSEAESARRELGQLQLALRQLSEEKEMAEESERLNPQHNANGGDVFRATESHEHYLAAEEARRSVATIRKRTLELESIRELVSLVTRQNAALQSAMETEKNGRILAERKALEAQIEIEIWRERAEKNELKK